MKNEVKKSKPNWIKIRNEYETSDVSQRELAKKWNVSPNTLIKRANRESWAKNKEKITTEIATKVQQKTIEKISDKLSDRNSRHIFLIDKLLDACETILTEQLTKGVDMFGNVFESEIINHAKVARLMETLEKAQKCHRIAEEKIDALDIKKLELEAKKVDIASKKAGETEDEEAVDDGFLDALNKEAGKVWDDESTV